MPESKIVAPARRMSGEVIPPGDKSISHRIAMLASCAAGRSEVVGFLHSTDCLRTLQAMQALGARADWAGEVLYITGTGGNFMEPVAELDMGNSGTGIRLLTGLLAGAGVKATLTGDASLRSRPMGRIREPLAQMGAHLELTGERGTAPVRIEAAPLKGITYEMPVASAQVKSALLLASLYSEGLTIIREPMPTRDHTERLLEAMNVPVRTTGMNVSLEGGGPDGYPLAAGRWRVPGDMSSAAFLMVAAAARPGAEVLLRGVGLNPRRTAVLDVLRRMGAEIEIEPADASSGYCEPAGDLRIRGGALRATEIGGVEIPNLIDELPALAVAAALAEGETVIRDAAELRVKESDRIVSMAAGLREMGVEVDEQPDGMIVRGRADVRACDHLNSRGDHRVAMALAVLALFAPESSAICDVECVDTSYPDFWEDLARISGR
ncbi:MAG: 3-phosphoshikimate 1-carboxyvinyltransferase [Kiritimatiellae bacterium]|nr:3-phosphoshikimate 1-carboxyvinyltransferase [Kiritimatiellia bacterium]